MYFTIYAFITSITLALGTSPLLAQTAYSPINNQTSVHNACWQALRIPASRSYPTNPQHAQQLEACKAAGGPNAYFARQRGQGTRSAQQQRPAAEAGRRPNTSPPECRGLRASSPAFVRLGCRTTGGR